MFAHCRWLWYTCAMTISSASGKVILVGEHAVVYGRPAIAVPVAQVEARAEVAGAAQGQGVMIEAPDIGLRCSLAEAPATDPHAATVRNTLAQLGQSTEPDVTIRLSSSIPIASGLGSGAAIAVALVRALAAHLGQELPAATVSDLAFETEKLHHGTPSGIDNAVIAYAQPIYFVRERPPERFAAGSDLPLVVADTGVPSPTKAVVGAVREAWQANPNRYEALFDQIASLVRHARRAIEATDLAHVGQLMNRNHQSLEELDVSSPALNQLILAARQAGAWGAKLSGGGRGGNVIALVPPHRAQAIVDALYQAGAAAVIGGR